MKCNGTETKAQQKMAAGSPGHCIHSMDHEHKERLFGVSTYSISIYLK